MIAELCIDVINSFKQLTSCLGAVTEHVCTLDAQLPAWFNPPLNLAVDPNSTTRAQACKLLCQLEYLDQQQPREILIGAGLIAASSETIDVLKDLNAAKDQFKSCMLKLKTAKLSHDQLITQLVAERHQDLASELRRLGLGRIHLKQCYRKVPYFLQRPSKVSWTWANTRSIKKISVQQAEDALNKHTRDAGIERQLKLLQGLDPNEPLAIIQELAPHLRANVVMPNGKRLMVKGPVPLFYLADDNLMLPDFTPPGAKRGKDKERVIRSDVKINPEPFLPAIRAHRYYEPCKL